MHSRPWRKIRHPCCLLTGEGNHFVPARIWKQFRRMTNDPFLTPFTTNNPLILGREICRTHRVQIDWGGGRWQGFDCPHAILLCLRRGIVNWSVCNLVSFRIRAHSLFSPRMVGKWQAFRTVQHGKKNYRHEAFELGLVNKVVEAEEAGCPVKNYTDYSHRLQPCHRSD